MKKKYIYSQLKIQKKEVKDKIKKVFQKAEQVKELETKWEMIGDKNYHLFQYNDYTKENLFL